MHGHYILRGKLAVPCDDLMEWARWFETADRHIWSETVGDTYWVSTVFLGLDHSFGDGLPILFETMVFTEHTIRREFNGRVYETGEDVWSDRCGTWQEALEMHECGVAHARALLRQLPMRIDQ